MNKFTKAFFFLAIALAHLTYGESNFELGGVVIHHIPASTETYVGSPGIAKLTNDDYLAKCDLFGPNSNEFTNPITKIFISHNKGKSWSFHSEIEGLFWATLFTHKKNVYLIGTNKHDGPVVILRSEDNGKTWTKPIDENTGLLLKDNSYHCGPVPVVFHNGRIFRAMEDTKGSGKELGHLRPFMLSTDIDADLLKADNWIHSNSLDVDNNWLDGSFKGWLEGNAVVTSQGTIVDILRVDRDKGNKAAIVNISDDGEKASFDPNTGFIDFPGGAKKFTIRFDPRSKKYWSLVNYTYPKYLSKKRSGDIRNCLVLTCSANLINWQINSVILYSPDINHGFQYVDWIFDGNDIIATSRTAYKDKLTGPHSFHDANYLTFHRIKKFRKFSNWYVTENISTEKQITFDSKNHELDNNDNFSPDSKWLCYDTRKSTGGIGGNNNIEKVNIETSEMKILYRCPNQTNLGPGVGAVSYSPAENKVIFIHGLTNCNENRPYDFSRRTGVMIDESKPAEPIFIDARDVTFPFTPGALRGGTHRHQFSDDGQWIGFTYNDAIMAQIEKETGKKVNLRTIGVSTSTLGPVKVDCDNAGENINGKWFSALVVKVVPEPKPDSDEISKAYGDTWIGSKGYLKPDGSYQRARVFLGDCHDGNNNKLTEAFIVNIPEKINIPSNQGPLQGTINQMPAPPKGTVQKRLTYTESKKHPGIISVSSSYNGQYISFVAKDNSGIEQAFLMSPTGNDIRQITRHKTDIQGNLRWNPKAAQFCYVCDNSIFIYDIDSEKGSRKTKKSIDTPFSLVWAGNSKIIAYNRKMKDKSGQFTQIFVLKLQ